MHFLRHSNQLRKFTPSRLKTMFSTQIEAQVKSVDVNSNKIRYVKVGSGPNNLICFNGSMGSFSVDFKAQIEQFDREKFTLIAWDLPGFGLSRPPNKMLYKYNFLEENADLAFELSKKLGIEKFSLLGWCDGGTSSIILASKHPDHVENLIVCSTTSYVSHSDLEMNDALNNVSEWPESSLGPYLELYGIELMQELQDSYNDSIHEYYEKNKGDLCRNHLKNIKCPTLILQGDNDIMVPLEHAVYLNENIKEAVLIKFARASHFFHMENPVFNEVVTDFILNRGKISGKFNLSKSVIHTIKTE